VASIHEFITLRFIEIKAQQIAIINKAGMSLSSFMECSKMIKP
jgi:hypothetical protein